MYILRTQLLLTLELGKIQSWNILIRSTVCQHVRLLNPSRKVLDEQYVFTVVFLEMKIQILKLIVVSKLFPMWKNAKIMHFLQEKLTNISIK